MTRWHAYADIALGTLLAAVGAAEGDILWAIVGIGFALLAAYRLAEAHE